MIKHKKNLNDKKFPSNKNLMQKKKKIEILLKQKFFFIKKFLIQNNDIHKKKQFLMQKKYLMVKIFYAKIVLIQKKIDAKQFSYRKIFDAKNF